MGMPIGASRGFSAPVSMPIAVAPPPPAPAPPMASAAATMLLNTEGSRGTKVNTSA